MHWQKAPALSMKASTATQEAITVHNAWITEMNKELKRKKEEDNEEAVNGEVKEK